MRALAVRPALRAGRADRSTSSTARRGRSTSTCSRTSPPGCTSGSQRAETDDVLVFGHTHKPWIHEYGGVLFVNCGSVGKPKDGDPRAAFAILELDETGAVRASIERVPYDAEAVAREVAARAYRASTRRSWSQPRNTRGREAKKMKYVLFVCTHNAGRSQMAQALFERALSGRLPRRVGRLRSGPEGLAGGGRGDARGRDRPVAEQAQAADGRDAASRRLGGDDGLRRRLPVCPDPGR